MTSSQCSLDLLGVKEDELDFIEIKYKGLSLGKEERKIKQLFDEKKVKYVVWDIELPEDIKLTKRNSLLEFFVYNFLTTLGLNSTIVSTIILYY